MARVSHALAPIILLLFASQPLTAPCRAGATDHVVQVGVSEQSCRKCDRKHGDIVAVTSSGVRRQLTTSGMCSDPIVVQGRDIVVWSDMEHYDGPGAYKRYCFSKSKVVYKGGSVAWNLEPAGCGMIEDCRVLRDGRFLAIKVRKTRGPAWFELYDLLSGIRTEEEKLGPGHDDAALWWSRDMRDVR